MSPRAKLDPPPNPAAREYGFLLFKGKFMVRHRSFKDTHIVLGAIRDLVPAHVYFSTAYYRDPTAGMEQKGWLGADLVFDIDADHLDTSCKPTHDSWKCKGCGAVGVGSSPKLCPTCKGDRMEEQTWLCERCLQQAKEETVKLLNMLHSDFAFDPKEIGVFFSGHRGFHVHVYSEPLKTLGEEERRELSDYMMAVGFDAEFHGLFETPVDGVKILEGPAMGQPGWRGRIVKGIYDMLGGNLEALGLSQPQLKSLRDFDREEIFRKPVWSLFRGIGVSTWKSLVEKSVEKARIDTVVTTDVHRLIRMSGTLNGHTGLLAMRVAEEGIDEFDPFNQAVAFEGQMKVEVKECPEFRMGERYFGPYRDERIELPSAAAMLLLCKHRAEPVA
ncbi:MAG TPA: DNA primase small subunit domain-containing protein [Candidatus Bathyarchaeia archaeon]|nr:DNA primase small subunit domain-containing protein [Candidatus Bathyarchaeia archaeon]